MAKVKIYVSRDRETGQLHLRDSEGQVGNNSITTLISPGDEVEWIPGEGVDEIKGIHPVNGSQNIFRERIQKNGHGSWKGRVNESAQGSEEYEIEYVAESTTSSSNPKLKVKPPRQ